MVTKLIGLLHSFYKCLQKIVYPDRVLIRKRLMDLQPVASIRLGLILHNYREVRGYILQEGDRRFVGPLWSDLVKAFISSKNLKVYVGTHVLCYGNNYKIVISKINPQERIDETSTWQFVVWISVLCYCMFLKVNITKNCFFTFKNFLLLKNVSNQWLFQLRERTMIETGILFCVIVIILFRFVWINRRPLNFPPGICLNILPACFKFKLAIWSVYKNSVISLETYNFLHSIEHSQLSHLWSKSSSFALY